MNFYTPQLTPGFVVLHGNRTEDLRDLLTGIYKNDPLPPLWSEVILVQSNGMKHWLELALADDEALGICAATRLELPSKFMWQVYRHVLGADKVPKHMPFDKDSLLWRLYRILPELVEKKAIYQPLQHYLSRASDGRKLYQLAAQIADVFDAYQNYRADWLLDWSEGRDLIRDHHQQVQALSEDFLWQPSLWREIAQDIGESLRHTSRSSVHAQFMQEMPALVQRYQKTQKLPYGIPPRITVFGVSSMPMQMIEALAELGRVCQVFVLVQNPCQYYWGDLIEDKFRNQGLMWKRHAPKALLSYSEPSALAQPNSHPLLASWGKQGRDYLHLLDQFDEVEKYKNRYAKIEIFVDPVQQDQVNALNLLQSAIFNLETPTHPLNLQPQDQSIELIRTFSAMREVQVLHDKILHWLDKDRQLLPGDIMVMVPNMEKFAAPIHAVFGKFKRNEKRFIPYSVADASLTQSPLVLALEQIISLDRSRVTLQDCFSMLELPAIREKFQLTEQALETLKNWLSQAGVKWGLDASHRSQWGINSEACDIDQNTWQFGLHRLLLGYALGIAAEDAKRFVLQPPEGTIAGSEATSGIWQNNLALSAVSSLDAPTFDGLLAWQQAVSSTILELTINKTPEQWRDFLHTVLERFFLANSDSDEALIQKLRSTAQTWLERCQESELDTELPIEVVRDHFLLEIQEPSIHQRFFGGGVQFATLMPMRSIPFKVVAMLGMNDGQYPRQKTSSDFDLMVKNWRVGDRSRREDDRYLFLEAILAARQKLYISWQGLSAQDNSEKPPSVLVAQLLEYLTRYFKNAPSPQIHPLQPFSSRYFSRESALVTYDVDWQLPHDHLPSVEQVKEFQAMHASDLLALADASYLSETKTPDNQTQPSLPTEISLEQLSQYWRQPVEAFFRQRLGVYFEKISEKNETDEPFHLDRLEQYKLVNQLMQAKDTEDFNLRIKKMELSGVLPLAGFKQSVSDELAEKAKRLYDKKLAITQKWSQTLPIQSFSLNLEFSVLEDGFVGSKKKHTLALNGQVDGVWTNQENNHWMCLEMRAGAVLSNQVVKLEVLKSLWVQHLWLSALGHQVSSYMIGLDATLELPSISTIQANRLLQQLVAAYVDMWRALPKIACKTAVSLLKKWAKERNTQGISLSDLLAATSLHQEISPPQRVAILDRLHEAAAQTFDEAHPISEREESAYLSRAFQSYEELEQDMIGLTELIYTPVFQQVRILDAAEDRSPSQ